MSHATAQTSRTTASLVVRLVCLSTLVGVLAGSYLTVILVYLYISTCRR